MRVVRHPHMYPIEQDVDEDHSGFITFDELQSVVRRKLRKGPSVLDDGALKALWCAIDTNDSDRLERDEFARFLRLGTAASIEGAIKPPHKAPPRVVRSSTGSANSSCSSNQDIPDARVAATPRDETPNVTAGHFAEMHLDKDSDMAVDPSRQQWEVSADAMLSRDSLHESLLQLAPVSPSPPSLGEAMHMHQDQRAYLATTPGSTAHAAPARGTMMRTSATEPMLVRTPPGAYAYTGSGGRGGGRGIGAGSGRSGGGARASGAAGHVVRRQPQSLVRPPAQQSKARSPGAAPSGFAAWGSPALGLGSHTVGSPAGGGSRGSGSGAARVRPTSAPAPYASAGALPARAVSELAAIKELAGGANQLLASERQEAAKMRMEAYLAVQAAQAETSAAIARAAEREKAAAAAEAKLAMMREQIDATGRRDDLRLSTRLAGQRRMLEKEVRKVHVDAQLESEVQLAAMQLESSEAKVAQARLAATEIERSQLQRTIDELKEELATREREHQMAIEQAEAAALAKAGAVHDEEMRAASIARLQQQAARRLSQQGLARGFGTWRDGYLDRRWKMERLRVAVATMMRPQLMRGFGVWRDTCVRSAQHRAMQVVTSQAKDEASRHAEELEAARTELSKARKKFEREVARLRSEHAAELEAERASAATEMKRAQSDSASELAKARAALAELKEVFETTDEHVQRISLEREAAMQRLQQQVVRRLRLQGISRGFNAWRDGYRDQKWKMERLRIAAATMLRPQLMRGFGVWKEGWLQAKHRAAESGMQLESSEAKATQARLAATEIERSQLQRTIDELKEELATREREHQMAIEQAEAAALAKAGAVHDEEMRAASIARLQQQAARRLSQQGLARGFGTWRDGYLDRRWKMERLRVAVATMMRPQLMRGFGVWRDTCVRSAQHRAMQVVTSQAKDEASRHAEELEAARTELSKARKKFEREVARLRSEHAAELEAERASAATEMKRAQSDSASELAKARAALAELKEVFETTDEHVQRISLEREAAMQRLQQQVVRRLRLQGISRGFNAWRDGYRDQKWKMERLRIAAATMLRPQLMRGFGVWKEGWLQAKHRAAEQVHHSKGEYEAACHADELTAARAALAEAQRSHQAEVARLQREHAAAMDAEREAANQELERVAHEHALTLAAQRAASEEMVRTLQSDASTREEELTRKLSGEIEASHEAAVATIARQALRKLTQQALSRGFNAWADGYRQRVRQQRLLRHAAARMAKPLLAEAMHEWIGAWEVAVRARERAEAQASLSAEAERARSLEAELAASHAAKEKAAARAAEVEATAKGAAATEATLTQSLERARSEGERLSAELALERTALGDERQKAVALVAELEKLRQQVALGREAEVAAREAVAAATHRCKLAEERAASAEQSEAEFRTGTEARLSALLADQRHSLEEVTAIVRAESAVGIERLTKEKRALEQRVRKLEEELSKRPPAPKPAQAEQTDGESVDSDEERRRRQLHKIKVKPFNFLSDARAGGRTTRLERLRMQEVAAAFRAKLAAKSRRGRGGAHEPMTDERAATKLQAVWRGRQIRVLLKHSRPSSPSSAGSPRPVRPRPKALP